jgi:hypothetical protein
MKLARIKYGRKIKYARIEGDKAYLLQGKFNSILKGKIKEEEIVKLDEIKFLPPSDLLTTLEWRGLHF